MSVTYIAEQIFEKKIIENGYFYMRVNERYISTVKESNSITS